jgi:hypothetical protein
MCSSDLRASISEKDATKQNRAIFSENAQLSQLIGYNQTGATAS